MKSNTNDNCTVPWIRDNDNICTEPEDINTACWIAWNRVTNQRNDCEASTNYRFKSKGNC